MREIVIKPGEAVPLGFRGENDATQILFDVTGWAEEFGEGVFQLLARLPGDEDAYTVPISYGGGYVRWTVTSGDTAITGSGAAQLEYYVGTALAKSCSYLTVVAESLGPSSGIISDAEAWAIGERDGEPVPESDETYHNNAKYYAGEAEESATQAATSATQAGTQAQASSQSATEAAGSATQAAGSATAAAASAAAAQTAAERDVPAAAAAWLAEHVDPETGYVLDDSLTIQGAAADAKAAGEAVSTVASRITSNAVTGQGLSDLSYNVVQGMVRPSNGSNGDSTLYIRSAAYTQIKNKYRVTCAAGYELSIYIYTGTTYSTYVGWVDADGSVKTGTTPTWATSLSFGAADKSNYYRICVRKADGSAITPADEYGLTTYVGTNQGLTLEGIPADAKAVGDILAQTLDLGFARTTKLTSGADLNDLTTPGRYYTDSIALSASIVNTPTSTAAYTLVVMQSISAARCFQFAFVNYGVTGAQESLLSGILVRHKHDTDGGWSNWQSIPSTALLNTYNPPTIRVMQYNIGKFRWGYVDGLEKYGLTEEQYKVKLRNYKRFFGDYRPDVLGLQECTEYMDKAQTHKSKEVLFNGIFNVISPNSSYNGTLIQCELCACGNLVDIGRLSVRDTGGSVMTWFRLGTLQIGGKRVRIATGALSSSGTPTQRAEQLEYLINNDLGAYDYAIILSDLNSGYRQDEETGELIDNNSLSVVLAKAAEYGFTGAQGMNEYWYPEVTYVHHEGVDPGNLYSCLDNILVKGNLKIRNFEVLMGEYEGLASDHVPVIADIFVY